MYLSPRQLELSAISEVFAESAGAATNGSVVSGSVVSGSVVNGSVVDGLVASGSVADGSVAGGLVVNGLVVENLARDHKLATGRFLTRKDSWLVAPVVEFVGKFSFDRVFDPFAGAGDMLAAVKKIFPLTTIAGCDLYDNRWQRNDSLLAIPVPAGKCFVATNPPYLAKYSASRKGLWSRVERYFRGCRCEDLYQVALLRLAECGCPFVAIVPETFLTSGMRIAGLERVVVLLENPFEDTDVPVCVVCVNPDFRGEAEIFAGARFLGNFEKLLAARISPQRTARIEFNAPDGQIGLRAVDSTDPADRIRFMPVAELAKKYGREKIKNSSRLLTYLEVREPLCRGRIEELCRRANSILEEIREASCDIVLSAFKGNTKSGTRRRRLDYALARAILEKALSELSCDNAKIETETFELT